MVPFKCKNVFVIDKDSGSREVRVSAAEILFLQNGSSWTVGIHVSGFDPDSDYVLHNQIIISRLPEGRFRVQWSGVSEDFWDRFRVDVVAREVSSILYP